MITFYDVEKTFRRGNESWKFGPLSLEIQKGEFLTLMGRSGSGKSTLLHLAGGVIRPDSGKIIFQNEDINTFSEIKLGHYRNEHIGFVFQEFFLMGEFSLLENTLMPLLLRKINRSDAMQNAKKAIERVGLAGKENNRPAELSGGQRQRAAIARAIVGEPEVLLADEPTGNLDIETGKEIIDLLSSLNKENTMTLLLATHDASLADSSDRQLVISNGVFSN